MIRVIYWNILINIKSMIRYKFSLITDLVLMIGLFVFFLESDTGTSLSMQYSGGNAKTLLLIGYIMWTYSITAVSTLNGILNDDAKGGTLHAILNSKYPSEIILFVELISAQIIQTVVVIVLVIISKVFFNIPITAPLMIIVPIILCILGMFGIGLILAGVSVFFKRIGAITLLIQLFLLFVTDTVPTSGAIRTISQFIPLTIANDVARRMFTGMSYSTELIQLILLSAIWLVIGCITYRLFIRKAKKYGNLLFY